MTIKQVPPEEAHRMIDAGCPYVDVRTEREFAGGHPLHAVNVPVAVPDPATSQMRVNADFVAVVEAHFSKDAPLIVGCQVGGRSQRAAELLCQAGFTNVSNMQGGFGGLRDEAVLMVAKGWVDSGLPICRDCGEQNTYAALKARAQITS